MVDWKGKKRVTRSSLVLRQKIAEFFRYYEQEKSPVSFAVYFGENPVRDPALAWMWVYRNWSGLYHLRVEDDRFGCFVGNLWLERPADEHPYAIAFLGINSPLSDPEVEQLRQCFRWVKALSMKYLDKEWLTGQEAEYLEWVRALEHFSSPLRADWMRFRYRNSGKNP